MRYWLAGLATVAAVGVTAWSLRSEARRDSAGPVAEVPTASIPRVVEAPPDPPRPIVSIPAPERLAPERMAAEIDRRLGAESAPPVEDALFLRRALLDLHGRLPTPSEALAFAADSDPGKRTRLVASSVEDARFAGRVARLYRELLLPNATQDARGRQLAPGFEAWWQRQMLHRQGFDATVRALLTSADGDDRTGRTVGPQAFALLHDGKPEQLAGAVAKVFMAQQVQCAECHDHPFADWKQDQLWGFAAFFTANRSASPLALFGMAGTAAAPIAIPNTDRKAAPRFLDGTAATSGSPARQAVAEWVTSAGNRSFAAAVVNRYWATLFGRALVAPVDDLTEAKSPSDRSPERVLLDRLGEQFVLHGHDERWLVRTLAGTKVYATVATNAGKAGWPAPKPLPAALLSELVEELAGPLDQPLLPPQAAPPLAQPAPASGLLRTLEQLNGPTVARACSPSQGAFLKAVVLSPFLTDEQRLAAVYLGTLGRSPRPAELTAWRADSKTQVSERLGDHLWAALNSTEFAVLP